MSTVEIWVVESHGGFTPMVVDVATCERKARILAKQAREVLGAGCKVKVARTTMRWPLPAPKARRR